MKYIKTILGVFGGGVLLAAVLTLAGCRERGYLVYSDSGYYYPEYDYAYPNGYYFFGADFDHHRHHFDHDWVGGRHDGWSGRDGAWSGQRGTFDGGRAWTGRNSGSSAHPGMSGGSHGGGHRR
jgi:hypothetical protein